MNEKVISNNKKAVKRFFRNAQKGKNASTSRKQISAARRMSIVWGRDIPQSKQRVALLSTGLTRNQFISALARVSRKFPDINTVRISAPKGQISKERLNDAKKFFIHIIVDEDLFASFNDANISNAIADNNNAMQILHSI